MTPWDCEISLSFRDPDVEDGANSALCWANASVSFHAPPPLDDAERALRAIAQRDLIEVQVRWRLRVGFGVHLPEDVRKAARRPRSPGTKVDDRLNEFWWTLDTFADPAAAATITQTNRTEVWLADAVIDALEGSFPDAAMICGLPLADQTHGSYRRNVRQALEAKLRQALETADSDNLGTVEYDYVQTVLEGRLDQEAYDDLVEVMVDPPQGYFGFEQDQAFLDEIKEGLQDHEGLIGELRVDGRFPYVGDDNGMPEDMEAAYGTDALGRHMVQYGDDLANDIQGPFDSPQEARQRARQIAEDSHVGEPGEDAAAIAKRAQDDDDNEEDGTW
jgi:hypothetical protein